MSTKWLGALGALIAIVVLTAMGTVPAAAGGKGNRASFRSTTAPARRAARRRQVDDDAAHRDRRGLGRRSRRLADGARREGRPIATTRSATSRARCRLDQANVAAKLDGIAGRRRRRGDPAAGPAAGGGRRLRRRRLRPSAATPNENPYMPTRDTGAPQFVGRAPDVRRPRRDDRHPRHRHRPRPPELQTANDKNGKPSARSSTGSPTPTRSPTTTRPGSHDGTAVTVRRRRLVHSRLGHVHRADGASRTTAFGVFNERDSAPRRRARQRRQPRRQPGRVERHLRRAAGTCDNNVWVDTEPGQELRRPADDDATTRHNFDIGHFGTDNPATAVRETMPFVVQPTRQRTPSTSASSRARTARTSRASRPARTSSAAPSTAPRRRRRSSPSACCLFIAGCTAHALDRGHDLRGEDRPTST